MILFCRAQRKKKKSLNYLPADKKPAKSSIEHKSILHRQASVEVYPRRRNAGNRAGNNTTNCDQLLDCLPGSTAACTRARITQAPLKHAPAFACMRVLTDDRGNLQGLIFFFIRLPPPEGTWLPSATVGPRAHEANKLSQRPSEQGGRHQVHSSWP